MKPIYLDSVATCNYIPKPVLDEIMPLLTNGCSNASSLYSAGRKAKQLINNAINKIKITTNADNIYFTSGSTESNNWIINNFRNGTIISTKIEHHSISKTLEYYSEKYGLKYKLLDFDKQGKINLKQLKKYLSEGADLCTVISVNNETGDIINTNEIYDLCHQFNCKFHTDLTQSFSHIDITKLKYDYASISAHKFGGLQGTGALLCNSPIETFIIGGDQQNKIRGGTYNLCGIVAMGKACELYTYTEEKDKLIKNKKDYLISLFNDSNIDYRINSFTDNTVSNILNISIKEIEAESLLLMLDMDDIYVSSGSACNSGSLDPSHVIKAINVPDEYAYGTIRISINEFNTNEEIEYAGNKIVEIVNRLRAINNYLN